MQSQQAPFIAEADGRYGLRAPLCFASVSSLRQQGMELIAAASQALTLDLSGVPFADSAGLALLVDWLAEAQAARKKLQYVQPPPTLLALARLSDVEKLLVP